MKTALSCAEIVRSVSDGASLMVGGFMGVGSPERLLCALAQSGKRDLTLICNDNAIPGRGVARLITAGCVRRTITSHIGLNPETQRKMLAGEIEVDLVPQGTLAERIRAGGYGLGGILTRTGVGTLVAEGKPTLVVDGETFLVERPLRADFALIAARRVDYLGNVEYTLTATNFNPLMAMAADTVIVEAEEIVPVGVIPPDAVRTPGVLVDFLVARDARAAA